MKSENNKTGNEKDVQVRRKADKSAADKSATKEQENPWEHRKHRSQQVDANKLAVAKRSRKMEPLGTSEIGANELAANKLARCSTS